jgi:hypothetical protein
MTEIDLGTIAGLNDGYAVLHRFVAVLESHWKNFLDLSGMIDCALLENFRRCDTLAAGTNPDHELSRKRPFPLNTNSLIRFSTTSDPYRIILNVVHSINVTVPFIRKKNSSLDSRKSLVGSSPFYHFEERKNNFFQVFTFHCLQRKPPTSRQ